MSVERSGQAIDVETLKGQLATGGARGFGGGRQLSTDGTSRMNREVQVRICEGLGVKFPGPTRQTRLTYTHANAARWSYVYETIFAYAGAAEKTSGAVAERSAAPTKRRRTQL